MSDPTRRRPRRTVTVDPVVDAYLGQREVNAGRLIDHVVLQYVAERHLIEAAAKAGVKREDTGLFLGGISRLESREEGEQ